MVRRLRYHLLHLWFRARLVAGAIPNIDSGDSVASLALKDAHYYLLNFGLGALRRGVQVLQYRTLARSSLPQFEDQYEAAICRVANVLGGWCADGSRYGVYLLISRLLDGFLDEELVNLIYQRVDATKSFVPEEWFREVGIDLEFRGGITPQCAYPRQPSWDCSSGCWTYGVQHEVCESWQMVAPIDVLPPIFEKAYALGCHRDLLCHVIQYGPNDWQRIGRQILDAFDFDVDAYLSDRGWDVNQEGVSRADVTFFDCMEFERPPNDRLIQDADTELSFYCIAKDQEAAIARLHDWYKGRTLGIDVQHVELWRTTDRINLTYDLMQLLTAVSYFKAQKICQRLLKLCPDLQEALDEATQRPELYAIQKQEFHKDAEYARD